MKRLLALASVFLFLIVGKVLAVAPSEYINDLAGVLTAEQKITLNNLVNDHQKQTGNEVAVLIIPELKNETIESQAVKTFEEWGIGKKGKDNGVLLLVAVKDRKLRIEVGYGLEGVLTDLKSSQIINNIITPEFKNGNYYGGIEKGLREIISVIVGNEITPVSKPVETNDNLIGLLFFVAYLLFHFIVRTKSWWLGGVIGAIIGIVLKSLPAVIGLSLLGLLIDFILSKLGQNPQVVNTLNAISRMSSHRSGGGGGSSFGGFGGGRSGGGGSSGSW